MGTAVGRNVIFGTVEESSYGGGGTPNRFNEINSETLEPSRDFIVSAGLGGLPGIRNLRRGSRRVASTKGGTGDVVMEVPTSGYGRWLKHSLGSVSGPTSGVQTHTLGDLVGKSMAIQKQLRDASGTVISPFMARGCKVQSVEWSNDVRGILIATHTIDFREMETSTAAATASYPTFEVFHYQQAVVSVGGSTVGLVSKVSTKLTNKQKVDREYLGSAGLKSEPFDEDFPTLEGTITAEFDTAATYYDRFASDTPATLDIEYVSASTKKFKITVAEMRLKGAAPKVGNAGPVVVDNPWEGFYSGSSDLTVLYTSPDSAP